MLRFAWAAAKVAMLVIFAKQLSDKRRPARVRALSKRRA
jgi:hypothetical protein